MASVRVVTGLVVCVCMPDTAQIWLVPDDGGEPRLLAELNVPKDVAAVTLARIAARLVAELGWVTPELESTQPMRLDSGEVAQRRQSILRLLLDAGVEMPVRDIMQQSGMGRGEVYRHLERLMAVEAVERVGGGGPADPHRYRYKPPRNGRDPG